MHGFMNSSAVQQWGPLVARVFLAALFIILGVGKMMGFAGVVGMIGSAGLPMPSVLAVLTIFIEVVGGLMLLVGFMGRIAAKSLFLFTLAATLAFHTNISDQLQLTMALKNLSIMGGLLMVMVHGTGPMSMRSEESHAPENHV